MSGFIGRQKTIKTPSVCPISRDEFHRNAKPITLPFRGEPYAWESGTLGWRHNGKVVVRVGGVDVACTIDLKIYCNKSGVAIANRRE